MDARQKTETAIVNAALSLAATRAWQDVHMSDIAAEAGLGLAELAELLSGKADVLHIYGRQLDVKMLKSLDDDPVTGSPHDRLFDIIMRRLELMDGDKAAIRSIAKAPVSTAAGFITLTGSMLRSQDWILSAAGIEETGLKGAIRTSGLAFIYVRALRTWAEDDDPGLARTMAQLDRALRDGADWMGRAAAPATLVTALATLARGFMKARSGPPPSGTDTSGPSEPGTNPSGETPNEQDKPTGTADKT